MDHAVPPPPKADNKEVFTIERIFVHHDFRVKNSSETLRLYLTKWEGFPVSESSWQKRGTLDEKTVKLYEYDNGDLRTNYHDDVKFFEIEMDSKGDEIIEYPPIPDLLPTQIVKSRLRYNYGKGAKETMYLVEFQYVPYKLWEPKDSEVIKNLIVEYERGGKRDDDEDVVEQRKKTEPNNNITGQKRKRGSEEFVPSTDDTFNPSDFQYEYPSSSIKRINRMPSQPTRKKPKKKKKKRPSSSSSSRKKNTKQSSTSTTTTTRRKKRRKKNNNNNKNRNQMTKMNIRSNSIEIESLKVPKNRNNINDDDDDDDDDISSIEREFVFRGHAVEDRRGGRKKKFHWSFQEMKKLNPELTCELLKDSILALIDDSGEYQDELVIDFNTDD